MKKNIIALMTVVTLACTGAAMADGFNNGTTQQFNNGYTGQAQALITVEQAKQMPDDAWVTLQGNIVKQIGDEDYVFQDSTGQINVEIDQKYWRGITINPTDLVQITGEVETHRFKPVDIDVKNIQVISSVK